MTAPVIVHLMRHGEPVLAGRMLGRTDVEATPVGVAACVERSAPLDFAAVTSSDLRRAIDCAEAIAERRGAAVTIDQRWRELDFGDWDGLPADAIDAGALGRFWQDPDECAPPNGERWSTLTSRVEDALAGCEDATLVVTHAGAIRAALAVACGFAVGQTWSFDLPYAAVVTLKLWRGEWPAAQIVRLTP